MEVKCASIMRRLHTTLIKQQDQRQQQQQQWWQPCSNAHSVQFRNETYISADVAANGSRSEQSGLKAVQ